MGKRVLFDKPWGWMYAEQNINKWTNVKHYSTHMLSAMEVVEYLRTKGCGFQLKMDNIIWAEFYGLGLGYFTSTGSTPSEAICKASLLVSLTKDIWYEK